MYLCNVIIIYIINVRATRVYESFWELETANIKTLNLIGSSKCEPPTRCQNGNLNSVRNVYDL